MEIYFCDLCNESVPQGALERGRARMQNGRVICEACEAAMSPEGEGQPGGSAKPGSATGEGTSQAGSPKATAGPKGGGGSATAIVSVVLASLALLVAGVGCVAIFVLFDGRIREVDGSLATESEARAGLARSLAQEWRRDLNSLDERVTALGTEEETSLAKLGSLDERMQASLASLGDLREDVSRTSSRIEQLDTRAGERHEDQRAEIELLTGRVRDLEAEFLKLVARVEAGSLPADPAPLVETPGPVEAEPAAWLPLVSDLKSQNSGTRWQAVQELGATGDQAVAEHLTPMLNDPDIFVRMATARILGDLEAVVGIPALIDALEDPEASVREAAVVSLRGITEQDFRFNPGDKDSERAKRVKAWRDWWSRASDDLLGR